MISHYQILFQILINTFHSDVNNANCNITPTHTDVPISFNSMWKELCILLLVPSFLIREIFYGQCVLFVFTNVSHTRNNEYSALICSIEEFHRGSSDHSGLTLMWKSSHSPHLIAYSHFPSQIYSLSHVINARTEARTFVYMPSTPTQPNTNNSKVILHKLLLHLQPAIVHFH